MDKGLTFDIDGILNDAQNSGLLTSDQITQIKNRNTKTPSNNVNTKTAQAAGIAGDLIRSTDSKGTNTAAQSAGGIASGASVGASFGPYGAAIGGVLGGLQGALSADVAREQEDARIESQRITSISNIQNSATEQRNKSVDNLISGLSQSLLR